MNVLPIGLEMDSRGSGIVKKQVHIYMAIIASQAANAAKPLPHIRGTCRVCQGIENCSHNMSTLCESYELTNVDQNKGPKGTIDRRFTDLKCAMRDKNATGALFHCANDESE